VAIVALIDAQPANVGYEDILWWNPAYWFRFGNNFRHWLKDFMQLPSEDQRRFFARKVRALRRKIQTKLGGGRVAELVDLEDVIDPAHFPEHELKLWEVHIRALVEHVERPYVGAVTLFRTQGQPLFCSLREDFCWGRLAKGGLTLKFIPGSHENIFMEPNVQHLAAALDQSLADARARFSPHAQREPLIPITNGHS
jgi:hypothetical protein